MNRMKLYKFLGRAVSWSFWKWPGWSFFTAVGTISLAVATFLIIKNESNQNHLESRAYIAIEPRVENLVLEVKIKNFGKTLAKSLHIYGSAGPLKDGKIFINKPVGDLGPSQEYTTVYPISDEDYDTIGAKNNVLEIVLKYRTYYGECITYTLPYEAKTKTDWNAQSTSEEPCD